MDRSLSETDRSVDDHQGHADDRHGAARAVECLALVLQRLGFAEQALLRRRQQRGAVVGLDDEGLELLDVVVRLLVVGDRGAEQRDADDGDHRAADEEAVRAAPGRGDRSRLDDGRGLRSRQGFRAMRGGGAAQVR